MNHKPSGHNRLLLTHGCLNPVFVLHLSVEVVTLATLTCSQRQALKVNDFGIFHKITTYHQGEGEAEGDREALFPTSSSTPDFIIPSMADLLTWL